MSATELTDWLRPADFIDSDHPEVMRFVTQHTGQLDEPLAQIKQLYLQIRDGIHYDPYYVGRAPSYYRASDCLQAGRGFCIPKAALLAACARVLGVPARVGYADVRNHLSTPKLDELVGSNLYRWHSYTDLYLNGRWVKATPAFNKSMCERFGVHTLEFDGVADSLLQEFDRGGRRHMDYVNQRGVFADVPYQEIVRDFERYHLKWLDNRLSEEGESDRAQWVGE